MKELSWRKLLKNLLKDNTLTGIIAKEIKVNPVTLIRWTDTKALPHRANLEQLLVAPSFPSEYRDQMIELLRLEFPDFSPSSFSISSSPSMTIPSEFYYRVLKARAETEALTFATIVQLVSQQIERHLSIGNDTLRTALFLLTPPEKKGDYVRSLYTIGTRLTSLPKTLPLFAGIESPISMGLRFPSEPLIFSARELPMPLVLPELVAVRKLLVIPILCRGRLGGCFLVASEREDFMGRGQEEIARGYGFLLSLALAERDFYTAEQIALCVFPPLEEQLEHEKAFPFSERIRQAQSHLIALALTEKNGGSSDILNLENLEKWALRDLELELMKRSKTEV